MNIEAMMAKMIARAVEEDRAWMSSSRRGRWVVMEPGPSRYLRDSSPSVRRYIDWITPRRGRRFSSLSRARAFARKISSHVARWHRIPPSGKGHAWRRIGPWEYVLSRGTPFTFLNTLASELLLGVATAQEVLQSAP